MSWRSPHTVFIFIIYDFISWIEVSKNTVYLILKTESIGEGSVQQILSTVVPLIIQKMVPLFSKIVGGLQWLTGCIWADTASASFLAELSVSSPRKLFIFII